MVANLSLAGERFEAGRATFHLRQPPFNGVKGKFTNRQIIANKPSSRKCHKNQISTFDALHCLKCLRFLRPIKVFLLE